MVLLAKRIRLAPALLCLVAGGLGLGMAAAVTAQATSGQTLLTGEWAYTTRIGPVPLGSDNHCLTKKDVENFNRGLCTKHYTCDYQVVDVHDGQVALKGTWTDKKGTSYPVTANGQYTPESFTIDVQGEGLGATISANRVSPTCAAG